MGSENSLLYLIPQRLASRLHNLRRDELYGPAIPTALAPLRAFELVTGIVRSNAFALLLSNAGPQRKNGWWTTIGQPSVQWDSLLAPNPLAEATREFAVAQKASRTRDLWAASRTKSLRG